MEGRNQNPKKNVAMSSGHQTQAKIDDHVFSGSLDDYEIYKNKPIGYGASAIVYGALYKPLNKKVAVKIIDLDCFERNQIDEVRKETQLMSLSKHPNVLRVYRSFVNESKLYIVTPYMSAGSCSDIMKSCYPDGLEETVIATILKQALQGLDYLHKNGHIHRDVKAGNLLMNHDGSVLLADFGVASSLTENGERKGLRKTFVGTPCWMAPEVMEHEGGYDYKADIWSFGITSLELATGHAPFAKYPPLKVIMVTLSNDPPTLERDATKHKYSRLFKEMIDSCLQKDPSKRPSAEKLLTHPFFKQAKKKEYLYNKLLQGLPPLEDRPHKRIQQKPITYTKGVTWDFAIDSEHRDEDTLNETEDVKALQDKKSVKFAMQSEATVVVDADNPKPKESVSADARPKKSRFLVEELVETETNSSSSPVDASTEFQSSQSGKPQTSGSTLSSGADRIHSPQPQSEVIIKGRFSVVESSSSREKSIPTDSSSESNGNDRRESLTQEQSNEGSSVTEKSRFVIQQSSPQPVSVPSTNTSIAKSPSSPSQDSSQPETRTKY